MIDPMISTRVSKMLGIKYPLFQGAMAWIATGELAGAVSEAGGLGIIGTGSSDAGWLQTEITKARAITDKPFGVNLMLLSPHIEKIVETVVKEKVPVVTTGAGSPGKYISLLKNAGCKVIPVVSSVALARRLARQGADAIIAEGMEAGGHIGEITTMCLVPMVSAAVEIPVIAAGGIADGRGAAAAFSLGAEGIQLGTRFLCAEECPVHPDYQERIIRAQDRDTMICGLTTGHPVRVLKNKFSRYYLAKEREGCSPEELNTLGAGKYPAAVVNGDIENGSLLAGQISGLINSKEPAATIVQNVMAEAENILKRLGCEASLD